MGRLPACSSIPGLAAAHNALGPRLALPTVIARLYHLEPATGADCPMTEDGLVCLPIGWVGCLRLARYWW